MASYEKAVTTFTRGELSPRIEARIDYEGRFDGVKELTNFLVHVQGGAQKRSGTRFVAAAADETDEVRLIPFEFSVDQTYVIEATDLLFRFYTEEGQLVSGTPVEVVTPYAHDELADLKWTQSNDILFLAHGTYQPQLLSRTSATAFSLDDLDFIDGPYLDLNDTTTTLALSGTTGSVTVTASSTTGINNGTGFKTTDVGRLIRWHDGTKWIWLRITARSSSTVVTATIGGKDAAATTATDVWRLGSFSDNTGWPQVVAFHQGRLWFARTTTQPNTIWASAQNVNGAVAGSASYANFQPTRSDGSVDDSYSITATLDSTQANAVQWMMPSSHGLLVGTSGEEWLIRSPSTSSAITPTSIEAVRQSSWGSANILPARIGQSTLFVQRDKTVIRESAFDYNSDAFTGQNITYLSEHLFRLGAERLYYQQYPTQTIWALLTNNTFAGFTFDKDQKVEAWHHHELGANAADDTEILDICSIKTMDGKDQLWLAVRRTINGTQHQYIEFLEEPFDDKLLDIEDAFFVDCGLTYDGAAATTISGLDHLEGETVAILADGYHVPDQVVASGEITLSIAASKVQVGLAISAAIEDLPVETPNREGTFISLGKIRRAHQAHVFLENTVGLRFGLADQTLDEITFRTPDDPMDEAIPLFTGIKSLSLTGTHGQRPRVRIEHDWPLPCTVLAIAVEAQIHGS